MKGKSTEDSKKSNWKDWLGEGHFGKRLFVATLLFFACPFSPLSRSADGGTRTGDHPEQYIIAQVDFEFPDEDATQVIRQQSVRDIGGIYRIERQTAQANPLRF